jgi:hypothetical protein
VGLMNQTPTRINQFFTALFGLGLLNQLPTLKKVGLMNQAPTRINQFFTALFGLGLLN